MIKIEHLRKEYDEVTPLEDVNTTINDGDVIAIIGPSGTGKSTLIRCLNRLDKPTSGKIYFNDIDITSSACDITKVRQKMGMVFQSFNLFGHMTVLENVMYSPMKLLGMSKQDAYDQAMELLHNVGMDSRAMQYPDMLSGGQKQRVAIARTLSMKPEVILFDEPTSALDPTMVGEVQSVIRKLSNTGTTMLIVTHEMKFAREISNRVFFMDKGGIYEEGTPEQIFENPAKERTRQFIRQLKVFEKTIDRADYDFIEMMSLLNCYGYKNDIPAKTVNHLKALFEELCHVILLDALDDKLINLTVEYDDEQEETIARISYRGKEYNPLCSDNELSLAIIKNLTSNIKYTYESTNEFSNSLCVHLK